VPPQQRPHGHLRIALPRRPIGKRWNRWPNPSKTAPHLRQTPKCSAGPYSASHSMRRIQEPPDELPFEALGKGRSPVLQKNPSFCAKPLAGRKPLYEDVKAALVAKGNRHPRRGRSGTACPWPRESPWLQAGRPPKAPARGKTPATAPPTLASRPSLWLTADKLRNNMDAAEYKPRGARA